MKLDTKHTPQVQAVLVRDVMQTKVVSVRDEMSVEEVAGILTYNQISGAPVLDSHDNVVGVVSLSDLAVQSSHPQIGLPQGKARRGYYRELWPEDEIPDGFTVENPTSFMKVRDIMTPLVHRVHEDDRVTAAVSLMLDARIHRVLVTNGQTIVGIVSTMDLIALLPNLLQ
jgi:CBS domain-containing protein